MKTVLFFFCAAFFCAVVGAFAFESGMPPIALVVLDATKPPAGRLPDGWELKVNTGKPDVSTIKDGDASVLHFKSAKSSFALERGVDIDPAQLPVLAWRWKVTELPAGGRFPALLCR